MNKREKVLGLMVGVMVLLLAVWYSLDKVSGVLRRRQLQVSSLQRQIADKQFTVMAAQVEADRLAVYERRSLPADPEKALALYQTWLLDCVTDVGLEDPKVNVVTARGDKGVYHQYSFTVSGQGDLPRLVDFLYEFYSTDYLHRIRRINAKRVRDSKRLDLAFSIEAVSLPTSMNTDKLSPHPGFGLAQGDLDKYMEVILNRNLSGPPNNKPEIRGLRDQQVTTNETLSLEITANDADKVDRVLYSLEGDYPSDVRFDSRSGKLSWRPRETGDYEFVVIATDDGFPARSDRQSFKVTVREPEPEPPRPPDPPRELDFGDARFAFVTAITEVNGTRQTWISLRTQGKLLKLKEGDQFTIGDVNVVVSRIDQREVEVEAKQLDKRLIVSLGKNIADGEEFSISEL